MNTAEFSGGPYLRPYRQDRMTARDGSTSRPWRGGDRTSTVTGDGRSRRERLTSVGACLTSAFSPPDTGFAELLRALEKHKLPGSRSD